MPNPQDALPLPQRPDLDQYRKLAKDLLKASRAKGDGPLGDWAAAWVDALAAGHGWTDLREIDRVTDAVEALARRALTVRDRRAPTLADAQFVIARSHGFETWARLVRHLEGLHGRDSGVTAFESAADAVVAGDLDALRHLMTRTPALARARSTREHEATLLIYCAANGVENFRQRTPANIVAVAAELLRRGADVEAAARVYGGRWPTLGLAATSAHPRIAGVQIPLLDLLLDAGADINRASSRGIVRDCVANGCPEAAEHLARRGATLGLAAAAAVGRLDVVRSFVSPALDLSGGATTADLVDAFLWASATNRLAVVRYLLDAGFTMAMEPVGRQTGLHMAIIGGHLEMVDLLLTRGAPLDRLNEYGGTALGQALWCAAHGGDAEHYARIVERLIAAGAGVPARHPPIAPAIDAMLAAHGGSADPDAWWAGEGRRRRRGRTRG